MFAVAFGLAGTLTIPDRLEYEACIALLRELSARSGAAFDEPRARRLAAELFPDDALERDARPQALAEAVCAFLAAPLPANAVLGRFRQVADARAPSLVEPLPETRLTLARIASLNVPAAVLCNGWSRIGRRRAACAGFAGPVLVSEDLGAAKPALPAFEALIAAFALPPDRIWYVGSDPRADIDGAAAAGLHAIWLNPNDAPYPADLRPPARTIRRIDEMLPALCEEYTRSLLGLRYVMHSALAWRRGHFVPGVEYGLNDPETTSPL